MAERLAIVGGDAAGMSAASTARRRDAHPRRGGVRARPLYLLLCVRDPVLRRRALRRLRPARQRARPTSTARAGSRSTCAPRSRRSTSIAASSRCATPDAARAHRGLRPDRARHRRRGRARRRRAGRRRDRAGAHRRRRRALPRGAAARAARARSSSAAATSASRWPRRSCSAASRHARRARRPGDGHPRRGHGRPRAGRGRGRRHRRAPRRRAARRCSRRRRAVRVDGEETARRPRRDGDRRRARRRRSPRDAGLELGASGALRVDDHQRCPGHDGVFAAGDCVESWHRVLERPMNIQLGTHANKQGRIAGANATGADLAFPGVIGTAVSKICRYEVARTGHHRARGGRRGHRGRAATIKDRTRARLLPGRRADLGQARRRARTGACSAARSSASRARPSASTSSPRASGPGWPSTSSSCSTSPTRRRTPASTTRSSWRRARRRRSSSYDAPAQIRTSSRGRSSAMSSPRVPSRRTRRCRPS